MLKTKDGIAVPSLALIAGKLADANENPAVVALNMALTMSVLKEKYPDILQKLLQEFRLWIIQYPEFARSGVVSDWMNGVYEEKVDQLLAEIGFDPDGLS